MSETPMAQVQRFLDRVWADYERELAAAVLPLCEKYGFGAVMQAASDLWRQRDPSGAIALGECYGVLEARRARHRARSREYMRRKRAGSGARHEPA